MRRSEQRQKYDELLGVIRGIRRRWRFRLLLRGLAITLAAGLLALLGAGLLVDWLEPPARVVAGVRIGLAIVVAGTALWFLVRPLLRRVSDEAVALYLEEHEPSLEAAVLSALEARGEGGESGPAGTSDRAGPARPVISDALLRRTLVDAVRRVHAIDDGRWIERSGLIRVTAALVAVLVIGALVGVLGPLPARQGAVSLFSSPAPAEAAGPMAVAVSPGDATISRSADVSIAARLQGFDAELVELGVRSAGDSAFERLPMAAGADGRYGYLLFDLDTDTEYFVEAGDVRSEIFTLTVAELPYVDRMDLTLTYPSYTGLESETVADGGDVTALRGTTVEVHVTPTLPVDGGAIVVEGSDPIRLTADSTGSLTGSFRVRSDGFYGITLDGPSGEPVEASPRYVIDALSDGEPIVTFEEPGRDVRATAIDELFVEARAEDDYGVGAMTLHYTVNGGVDETVELYGGRGGLAEVTAGHTFYLEEYGLEPGDLVSYWATATDNDAVDGRKEATSDIYFVQVRPFRRDYSAAPNRQMPPGQGQQQQGPDGDLSELQRQIIAGTFNLIRDSAQYSAAEFRENLNTLALSQERLHDQTRTLAQRMVARRVTTDTAFQRIAEILPRAAEAMDSAVAQLRDRSPTTALPPEQRALQQLQRAEAIFREVQISLGQQQQGGGQPGGSPNAEDLADLFELEMDKLEDQYETVDRGGNTPSDSMSESLDETTERLEELARRQLQEAERRRREMARGQGTAGGDAQRQLAEQAEEEARRLERLSREQRRPELQEAARRLRDAAESMRRSASGDQSEAERAAERLREARRLLEQSEDRQLRRRAEEIRQETDRLAREQQELRQDAEELLETPSGAERAERQQRLEVQKRIQQDDVAELEQDLRELAGEAGSEQPDVARRLSDAAGQIAGSRLEEKIDFSRQLTRGGAPDEYVRELEEQIQRDLEELRDRLEGIDQAFRDREDGAEAGRAVEEARDLARNLESMRQRSEEARERAPARSGGGGAYTPEAVRQGRAEAGRRLDEARELRDRLREQGMDTEEVDGVIGGLQELTDPDAYRDPDALARVHGTLADQAKRLELVLRVNLAGEDRLRLFLEGDPSVDPEYRDLVEEYYRSLSREGDNR